MLVGSLWKRASDAAAVDAGAEAVAAVEGACEVVVAEVE